MTPGRRQPILDGSGKGVDATNLLVLVAAALLFLSFGFTEMAGSDMWWHIAAGRELLQTGTLWMVDDWSFSAHGQDWHNHEWLADLLYYGWVSALGLASLVYWKWLVIVATFTLLLLTLARQCTSALAALVATGLALAMAAPFLDVRPHLYTLLFYAVLLNLCLGRQPGVWGVVALFAVWVNLHGGFFFGLMALGILLFPWRQPTVRGLRRALAIGLLCLLASALNPYGIKAFLYPLTYAFDDSSPYRELGEWLSPFDAGGITSPLFFNLMWAPVLGLAYFLPAVRRNLATPWEGILLALLTLAMALTSRRFIPLFAMSLAVMLAPLLAWAMERLRLTRFGMALGVAALLYAMWRLLPYNLQSQPNFHYLTAEYSYPVDMLDFVERNNIRGNVYALYNWGGYIHWRTDGRLKVFIDGRADTLYDGDTYRRYITVLGSLPGWLEQLERSDAHYILWPHRRGDGQGKLEALLATGRWQPVYADAVSWLLVKATAPLVDLSPSPSGPWRDLAMAYASRRAGDIDAGVAYAQRVRAAIPWHQSACALLIESYIGGGERQRAMQTLLDCRAYFPSDFLRWPRAAALP